MIDLILPINFSATASIDIRGHDLLQAAATKATPNNYCYVL
jgi:hypothetical protein